MIGNFKQIKAEDASDDADRKKLYRKVSALENQVKQLQSDNKDHEKRLKKIEKLLFGFERVSVTDPSDDIKASQPAAVEISDTDGIDNDSVTTVTIN
ncbi:hypothetical protein FD27_GL001068 [Limosilactobacillus frumenti DSM 13145]|uniref:Uncharacterized protein n=2 Tax=Limosilactobacillus frumenti TaxID=104955 RepID=A0A0R1PB29_9LACO|nr:hypothetical protein FD27_GL001068 [Limosilactobacillus frumenti DSM 13145]